MSASSLVLSLNICAPGTQLLHSAQLDITSGRGHMPVCTAGHETQCHQDSVSLHFSILISFQLTLPGLKQLQACILLISQ